MELLIGTGIGFTVGLAAGLRARHCQIRAALEERKSAMLRAICAQAAANRLGWPERLP